MTPVIHPPVIESLSASPQVKATNSCVEHEVHSLPMPPLLPTESEKKSYLTPLDIGSPASAEYSQATPDPNQSAHFEKQRSQSLSTAEDFDVLLVEDTPFIAKVEKKSIEKRGLKVQWAEDGQEALDLIKRGNKYHLILMDYVMPRMNGVEATKAIRKIIPEVPIILVTSENLDSFAESELALFDAISPRKPFMPNMIDEWAKRFALPFAADIRR